MDDGVLLLGGTDATLAVAEAVLAADAKLCAIVTIGTEFRISYSPRGVANVRHADLAGWGARRGVPVIPFTSYDDILTRLAPASPSLCLAAGWYHMVPASFRRAFPRGCFGFHASLLPQLRGGAPLGWAILSGMTETGVTLFALENGIDDGLIYGQARFPVGPRATIADLVQEANRACAELTRTTIAALLDGTAEGRVQEGMPSYGQQRAPDDGRIDWTRSAEAIDRLIRASGRPYPGAFSALEGQTVHIWTAEIAPAEPRILGAPGQIAIVPRLSSPCVVAGEGALVILEASTDDDPSFIETLRKSAQKRFQS